MIATILLKYLRLGDKPKNFELIQTIEFAEKPLKPAREQIWKLISTPGVATWLWLVFPCIEHTLLILSNCSSLKDTEP